MDPYGNSIPQGRDVFGNRERVSPRALYSAFDDDEMAQSVQLVCYYMLRCDMIDIKSNPNPNHNSTPIL